MTHLMKMSYITVAIILLKNILNGRYKCCMPDAPEIVNAAVPKDHELLIGRLIEIFFETDFCHW